MRKSKVLARLRAGKPARLTQLGYYLPPFVAYTAHAGYDGIWLDLEHHEPILRGSRVKSRWTNWLTLRPLGGLTTQINCCGDVSPALATSAPRYYF